MSLLVCWGRGARVNSGWRNKWELPWGLVTQYCKMFYRIPVFLFFIYWGWQKLKCNLKCPKVYGINTELNCMYCLPVPILVVQITLPRASQGTFIETENAKCLNESFLKSKNFLFRHKRNFNPKVKYIKSCSNDTGCWCEW